MKVVMLRRYPVKAMGGEALESVELDSRGVSGDRWYAVEDDEGHFASGKNTRRFRRHDQVFRYRAKTTAPGIIVVNNVTGRSWTVGDPALDRDLSHEMGAAMRVTPESQVPHQDMGAVSLISTATLDWCADRWGINSDPRRLRVNIVFSSDQPFVEESWVGQTVAIGSVSLRIVERTPRCRMIDIDQDGAVASGRWLKPLASEREMFLAMYAEVTNPGLVSMGDRLSVDAG
ncbi:hypothetical protein UM93_03275 [Psychromicrobium lacuslunae]|uniref:MOSC domain-containing protein n=2 Tax=Psychromicrobium lacuslunae TaxID=1618207 RepID=A0A0D4C2S5_9MICC|nr:hypothetical protein UM93_03275 [Psychromicrobium lacuslunae]